VFCKKTRFPRKILPQLTIVFKKNTTLSFGCNPRANFKYLRVTMLIGGWFPRFISCRHAGVNVESIPGKVHQGQRVWVEKKQKNIF
jgi:hypothetical protein